MNTLISGDNTWALMAITCGWAAFSIYAEQTWKWASKVSGAIVALVGALVLTNLGIIPTNCVWFDDICWGFAVPMAIPMLLLSCDIRKIGKEAGKILILFLIGAVGTTVGAVLGFKALGGVVEHLAGVAAMMTGSYIGGTVNFAALSDAFSVPGETVSAAVVADNLLMTLYFFVLIMIPSIKFFANKFKHPHIDEVNARGVDEEAKTQAAAYWGKKPISLMDIAINVAISVIIVCVSTQIAGVLSNVIPKTNVVTSMLNGLFGNKYLILTTLTMIIATIFSKPLEGLSGSQEIGTYLIYLFFFAIGAPASIKAIFLNAPLLLVFCAIMVVVNMLFCFIFGKLLKFDLEDCILASNACIGGPTTAAAMAISKGWVKLVGPIMLVGTLGYVVGTYFGTFVGQFLGA
ncbi:MAG: DUF819 family protein [Bacteroidales bacterium]|nr:DUF819 family protein [Anaerotignum sp.]MCI5678518.1 DUF819 family protein [Bacteroidales bacterium]MDY3926363.1 DUF819 family protein [Anaerotignum sp.]